MAHDEAEEERAFLADLVPRTGRDLASWMQAISEQGFGDKNDTIDWLRAQGFPFARASWLERIHSNGGKPIYLDAVPVPGVEPPAAATPEAKSAPAAKAKPRESQPERTGPTPSVESLIAAAKGYRPLYQMLEAMIRQVVPGVTLSPRPTHISFAAGEEFAIVQPMPQEIRLGLALPGRAHDANLGTVKIKGAGSGITHMITLKDARQINSELQTLIAAAAGS